MFNRFTMTTVALALGMLTAGSAVATPPMPKPTDHPDARACGGLSPDRKPVPGDTEWCWRNAPAATGHMYPAPLPGTLAPGHPGVVASPPVVNAGDHTPPPRPVSGSTTTYGRGREVPIDTLIALLKGPASGWSAQMAGDRMTFARDAIRALGLTDTHTIEDLVSILENNYEGDLTSTLAKKLVAIGPSGTTHSLAKPASDATIVSVKVGTVTIPFWIPGTGDLVTDRNRVLASR